MTAALRTVYCIKLKINAKDENASNGQDAAISIVYGNKFIIPLDFEMLDSAMPYYQSGLGNRLCYEITLNDYGRVIQSTEATADATYKVTDIALEYEIVTQQNLTSCIATEYQNMALQFDRILRHRQIKVDKSDTMWNWSFNMPCKSLKDILVLFEQEQSFVRDTSKVYNIKVQKYPSS